MGRSVDVAVKRYCQVTDDHFARAAGTVLRRRESEQRMGWDSTRRTQMQSQSRVVETAPLCAVQNPVQFARSGRLRR
jgi:hypothetical protein